MSDTEPTKQQLQAMLATEYPPSDLRAAGWTPKATCFLIEGERVWIPKSQIAPDDVDQYDYGDADGSVSITEWIAGKEGFA